MSSMAVALPDELVAEDVVDLLLELVLHRAEVESLAEDVEEARGEEGEDLEGVEGRARGDERERAASRRSVSGWVVITIKYSLDRLIVHFC